MKIDRHNYEEYFLLYIDNELTVDQKKQVDTFIKENPDLEEELVMLQQSKLAPDHSIVFDKKNLLMRNENDSFISLSNYEEWFVLYVDDELTEEEKITVEKFAAAHPKVHQEFELFQQTKLQPEKIVFTNKEVLYRKEKVRIISMYWWRVAVAAILIIAAGITLFSVLRKENIKRTPGEIAAKKVLSPKFLNPPSPNKQQEITPAIKQEKEQMVAVVPKEAGKENKHIDLQYQNNKQPLVDKSSLTIHNNKEKAQPITSDIVKKTTQSQLSNTSVIGDKMLKENFSTDTVTKPQPETPQPMYASNTENKKFRGFFRKATRFIEHTTNINPANDDNKVLIGGMAINLK